MISYFNFIPNFSLSTGSACTSGTIERSHVLSSMKLDTGRIDGSFRISAGRNTTKEDIKEFYLGQQDEGIRGERRWKKKKMWR